MSKRPLILTALKQEAAAARRALGDWARVEIIGIRAVRMPTIDPASVECIILAGLAGGLDPSLQVGDRIVDDRSTWQGWMRLPLVHRVARVHTADKLVSSAADKAALFAATAAAVVDMESDIVRAAAADLDLPYLGLRAISDRAGDEVDPAVLSLVDPFGGVRPIRLASAMLRRPGLLRHLRRLSRDSKVALASLTEALAAMLL